MKKITSYILIFIVSVILLAPTTKIQALTLSVCRDPSGNNLSGITRENCLPPNEWITIGDPSCPPPKYLYLGVCTDYTPPPSIKPGYQILAPLPDTKGGGGNIDSTFNTADKGALSIYLNLIIRILIGVCAVLAVIMIVIGGMEYMLSELAHTKEHGKERIINALYGLLVALGAYALLFTINPDILNSDLSSLTPATITIDTFTVSGPLPRSSGTSAKVDFNTQAYPAAKAAGDATGVDPALILAIFAQETSSGANTGGCLANDPRARMRDVDKAALGRIVGGSIDSINVSCAGSVGFGGAIGLMQFLPTTWEQVRDSSARDPWNVNDALMVGALKLKTDGGATNPYQAACKYFGQCSSGGIDYAQQVIDKMNSLKQQIADAKAKGTIS